MWSEETSQTGIYPTGFLTLILTEQMTLRASMDPFESDHAMQATIATLSIDLLRK